METIIEGDNNHKAIYHWTISNDTANYPPMIYVEGINPYAITDTLMWRLMEVIPPVPPATEPTYEEFDVDTVKMTDPYYNADIDVDSNNNGTIDESDDPANDPLFETMAPGKIILYHDDGEADNLAAAMVGWNQDAEIEGFQFSFSQSGNALKVWYTQDKQIELTTAVFTVNGSGLACATIGEVEVQLPCLVYVEGCATGEADLSWIMKDPAGDEIVRDTVKFSVVRIDGVSISVEERVMGSTAWSTPDDNPVLWKMDNHRWKAVITPAVAEQCIMGVQWWYKSWEHRENPEYDATVFTTVIKTDDSFPYAIGTPPPGDWAIRPVVVFGDGTSETTTTYDRYVVCEITSVEWVGVDPGDGETNFDGTLNRIFPERNHPAGTPDPNDPNSMIDQVHDRIDVRVTITPAIPQGMSGTVYVKIYDPDNAQVGTADPNDPDVNTSVPVDNRKPSSAPLGGYSLSMIPFQFQLTFGASDTTQSRELTITHAQPGNNFIAAAHHQAAVANEFQFRDDGVSLFYRSPATDVEYDVPLSNRSVILEVWRTLWVESDHMDDPGDNDGPFNGDSGADDDPRFTPSDPTMAVLTALLEPVYVRVQAVPAQHDTRDVTDFKHYQNNATVDPGVRDVTSSRYFGTCTCSVPTNGPRRLITIPTIKVGSRAGRQRATMARTSSWKKRSGICGPNRSFPAWWTMQSAWIGCRPTRHCTAFSAGTLPTPTTTPIKASWTGLH